MGAVRVLLVDDSEDMRLLCRLLLDADPGFEVRGEAVNGEEAIRLSTITAAVPTKQLALDELRDTILNVCDPHEAEVEELRASSSMKRRGSFA